MTRGRCGFFSCASMSQEGTVLRLLWVVLLLLVPMSVHARVVFSRDPLFHQHNALAGDAATGSIVVSNPTDDPVDVRLAIVAPTSTRGLARTLLWSVRDDDGRVLYGPEVFSRWFDGTARSLGTLAPHTQRRYSVTLELPLSATSSRAGGSVAFSVCVGVGEGEVTCSQKESAQPRSPHDTQSDSPSGEEGGSSQGAPANGGVMGPAEPLRILDISAWALPPDEGAQGSLVVRWRTNRPATGFIVFGPVGGGPYFLALNEAHFGYPFASPEHTTPTTTHRVVVTGIGAGVYEVRAVSREGVSLPTVSAALRVGVGQGEEAQGRWGTFARGAAGAAGAGTSGGAQGEQSRTLPQPSPEGADSFAIASGGAPAFPEGGLAAALGVVGGGERVVSWIALVWASALVVGWAAARAGGDWCAFLLTRRVMRMTILLLVSSAAAFFMVGRIGSAAFLLWSALLAGVVQEGARQARLGASVVAFVASGVVWIALAVFLPEEVSEGWWHSALEPLVFGGAQLAAAGVLWLLRR